MVDVILAKLESIGSETDVRGFHPPFGILYLADSLEKAGFSVRLVHLGRGREEGYCYQHQSGVSLAVTSPKSPLIRSP